MRPRQELNARKYHCHLCSLETAQDRDSGAWDLSRGPCERKGGRERRKTEEHGEDLKKDVVSPGVCLHHCGTAPASQKQSHPAARGRG